MAQHDSAGAGSGNHSPLPLNKPLTQAAAGIWWWAVPPTFPSVCWQWSHHRSPGPCSGLAAWPTERLPRPWRLLLSSGALQVSGRLVRDKPSVHIVRKVSWLRAAVAAAGEDSAHFTALAVRCYSLKTCVYPCPDLGGHGTWRGVSPRKVGVGF